MVKYRRVLYATLACAGLLLAAVHAYAQPPANPLAKFQTQTLNWKDCGNNLQCSTFKVPMDYSSIDKNFFTLSVVRHAATDLKNRIGTLFVNPGGPGGSAVNYASHADQIVSSAITQRYDIVGFDPRGVGKSEPAHCLSDKAEDAYISSDTAVITKNDLNNLLAQAKKFADACARATGIKIGHYGSVDAARDMELLRVILNEQKVNYLGKSYGTLLGTLYAALYPSHVGKFVLDGAIDPNASNGAQNLAQAIGFDSALLDYIKKTKGFTQKEIVAFLNTLHSKPLEIQSGRKLTSSLAIIGIASTLYDNVSGWPNLTEALNEAINKGNGRPLLDLADAYNLRDANGHYSNENDIAEIISCLDLAEPRSIAQMTKDGIVMKAKAPVFGPFLTYAGLACKYWDHSASKKPAMRKILTSPVIVIGVQKDPATPYAWSKKLAAIFSGSALITFNGEGHTGHNRGSKCVDARVDSYLLGGPAGNNLTCFTM